MAMHRYMHYVYVGSACAFKVPNGIQGIIGADAPISSLEVVTSENAVPFADDLKISMHLTDNWLSTRRYEPVPVTTSVGRDSQTPEKILTMTMIAFEQMHLKLA